MRKKFVCLLSLLALTGHFSAAQGTVPTFTHAVIEKSYTLAGQSPDQGTTTTIPTVLVPVSLDFEAKKTGGKAFRMDARTDVPGLMRSPVFSKFSFGEAGTTQYADAMLRSTFPNAKSWHTLLGRPEVKPVTVTVPVGYGYVLTSKKSGTSVGVVDLEFLQKEIFKQVSKQDGKLVIALTHNTTFYAEGDATVCCSWGTHGVDQATGNSFVLASYLRNAPAIVEDKDVQPLTQQLAEFVNDPLHDPLFKGERNVAGPGNKVSWMRPASAHGGDQGRCGGAEIATRYFMLQPTDTNLKNNFPASKPFAVQSAGASFHVQNVALLPWYIGSSNGLGSAFTFPDAKLLTEGAQPCPDRGPGGGPVSAPTAEAIVPPSTDNGHRLIGYWSGYRSASFTFSLRDVSPQWDYVLVAFATPDKNAPEGTMQFHPPTGMDDATFKADVAYLKSKGKKVMISLGGGGQHFTLADPARVPTYVSSVTKIVEEYGFDGIDIDFESPSLSVDPGDTDFKHPTTPSIVNLIHALRQLHDHFGPKFMISLVPEGTQIPGGYPSYGGQFGSYLAITYAIRDILTFIDVQDYNTPPLQGLDGEIYQAGHVDYHAAMTELLLHGFNVGGDPKHSFPPLPAKQIAVGFLVGDVEVSEVDQAMEYILTGKAPAGTTYKLRKPGGYPEMIGAMFWTIDGDRRGNYNFSNSVGPQLHGYPSPGKK